jgi:hypothetical protein
MKRTRRNLLCVAFIVIAGVVSACWILQRSKPRLQVLLNDRSIAGGDVSFTLTNPTTIPYDYWVLTELKTNKVWNVYPSPQVMHWEDRKQVLPHQALTFSVRRPFPFRPEEWRATIACSRSTDAPPTLTARLAKVLVDWKLDWVVTRLGIYDKSTLIPGPEMSSRGVAFSSGQNPTSAPARKD